MGVVLPQAMADVRSEVHIAMAERDEKKIEEETREWKKVAARHWSKMSLTPGDMPDERKIVRHRAKTFEWLIGAEHMLWISTALRWCSFAQPPEEEKRGPPEDWPILTLSVDQGSDGWCGAFRVLASVWWQALA